MNKRQDNQGFWTKVTRLGDGYGLRVYRGSRIVSQDKVATKADIAPGLREMLRMIDKCGNPSDMASASRDRAKP